LGSRFFPSPGESIVESFNLTIPLPWWEGLGEGVMGLPRQILGFVDIEKGFEVRIP